MKAIAARVPLGPSQRRNRSGVSAIKTPTSEVNSLAVVSESPNSANTSAVR